MQPYECKWPETLGLASIVALIAVSPGAAIAQDANLPSAAAQPASENPAPATSPGEQADGVIIYSRDVHHSVGAPYFPGEAHSAVTAPGRAIVSTITAGLMPLTDLENSVVAGSISSPLLTGAPLSGAADLASQDRLGSQIASANSTASGGAGGAISGAMSSLSGALSSLSIISGGSQ